MYNIHTVSVLEPDGKTLTETNVSMSEKPLTIEDADTTVDVTGQVCAMPILTAAKQLQSAANGDLLAIKTGKSEDECEDVENWVAKLDGGSLINARRTEDGVVAFVKRHAAD